MRDDRERYEHVRLGGGETPFHAGKEITAAEQRDYLRECVSQLRQAGESVRLEWCSHEACYVNGVEARGRSVTCGVGDRISVGVRRTQRTYVLVGITGEGPVFAYELRLVTPTPGSLCGAEFGTFLLAWDADEEEEPVAVSC